MWSRGQRWALHPDCDKLWQIRILSLCLWRTLPQYLHLNKDDWFMIPCTHTQTQAGTYAQEWSPIQHMLPSLSTALPFPQRRFSHPLYNKYLFFHAVCSFRDDCKYSFFSWQQHLLSPGLFLCQFTVSMLIKKNLISASPLCVFVSRL